VSFSGAPSQPELLSFAAITDEPPAEIAAGHDRCIIPIRPQNIHACLKPDRTQLRERPYYEQPAGCLRGRCAMPED
jgi:hypothetical protein